MWRSQLDLFWEHYYKVRRSLGHDGSRYESCIISAEWVKMAKINKVFIQQTFPEYLPYARHCGYRDENVQKIQKDPLLRSLE